MVSNSYWWIVAIGLLIIFFFWRAIISAKEKEYYDIIWQNNLFRELGWKPPNLKPKFELIGTLVGEKIRIAYVRNIKSNKISRLGVGSNFNGDVVVYIKSNSMEMKKGELYELPPISFLNTNGRNRNTKRRSSNSVQRELSTKERKEGDGGVDSKTLQTNTRSIQRRWENTSPEERIRLIEQFRNMRGRRGRRRRNE